MAIKAPIHLVDNVNLRAGPSSTYARVGGIRRGTSPSFNCWAEGRRVGGNNVWFNVTVNGVTGFYSSYFDDSAYSANSRITPKYGIPHCGTSSGVGQGGIAHAERAIAWMSARLGHRGLDGSSLAAVSQAYRSAGVDITAGLPAETPHDTAFSFWTAAGERTHPDDRNPPRGALLFFGSADGAPGYVAIAISSTLMISTSDGQSAGIRVVRISSYDPDLYLGWASPS